MSWISWEKYYHCEKSLQQACCAPPPPPHTKKREIIFSVFCEKREISLKREGCDYALRRGADSKRKKSVCRGGLTKATHCSDSPTLEDVVQGLASLGLGWGSPALGAVWKQIFQVSASTVEENIIWLSIVSMNKQGLPQTARDVFFFLLHLGLLLPPWGLSFLTPRSWCKLLFCYVAVKCLLFLVVYTLYTRLSRIKKKNKRGWQQNRTQREKRPLSEVNKASFSPLEAV